jgi:hypothetical protein
VLYRPLTTEPLSDNCEAWKVQTRCNLSEKKETIPLSQAKGVPAKFRVKDNREHQSRKPLLDTMDQNEFLVTFCEGNPGCAGVVGRVYENGHMPVQVLTNAVDMNIRGAQFYVAYTAVCHGNISHLVDCILKRDPEFVRRLNDITFHPDKGMNVGYYQEKAVVGGWKPE